MLWSRFFSWLARSSSGVSRPSRQPAAWLRRRLAVETLDDRTLPSVLTVLNANDSGTGSLRDCINIAINGDTIVFDPSVQGTITLQSVLAINKDLTITGPGPGTLAVSGNNSVEVFSIDSGNTVSISGLTLENAHSAYGALDANDNSHVMLLNDVISQNTGTISGGGLSNFAFLTADHSTFSGNHGATAGGILNGGQLTVLNSTFSGNQSDQYGGGICETSNAGVKLTAVTIANNQATMQGGGLYISEGPIFVNLLDSVLAKNTAPIDPDFACPSDAVAFVTASNNFLGIKATSNGVNNGVNGNIVGVGAALDPLLGPLQNNGGLTPTLAPQANSPLLGKGTNDPSLGPTDQTGRPRAINGRVDIGAVEFQGVIVVPVRDIFAIGEDAQVYGHKLDTSGSPTGGYFLTQAGQVKSLVAAHTPDNNAEIFVIGLDNQVYAQMLDSNGNSVGGYFLTQAGSVEQMAVGQDGSQHPELFVIGLDGQVYAQKFDAAGNSASGYFLTQAGQVKSLSVTHGVSGNPALAVIGLDNQVYAQAFDASGNSASGYALVQTGQVKSLVATHDDAGAPEIFVIGLDNQVYGQRYDTQGNEVGGYFLTQPGQVQTVETGFDASGNSELTVIGLDNQVYAQKLDPTGASASGYFLIDAGAVKAVSTVG